VGRPVPSLLQQLPDDLRIGLAVEPVPGEDTRCPGVIGQRPMNGSPPRTIGAEQSAVDVEEEQFHAGKLDG